MGRSGVCGGRGQGSGTGREMMWGTGFGIAGTQDGA